MIGHGLTIPVPLRPYCHFLLDLGCITSRSSITRNVLDRIHGAIRKLLLSMSQMTLINISIIMNKASMVLRRQTFAGSIFPNTVFIVSLEQGRGWILKTSIGN